MQIDPEDHEAAQLFNAIMRVAINRHPIWRTLQGRVANLTDFLDGKHGAGLAHNATAKQRLKTARYYANIIKATMDAFRE